MGSAFAVRFIGGTVILMLFDSGAGQLMPFLQRQSVASGQLSLSRYLIVFRCEMICVMPIWKGFTHSAV